MGDYEYQFEFPNGTQHRKAVRWLEPALNRDAMAPDLQKPLRFRGTIGSVSASQAEQRLRNMAATGGIDPGLNSGQVVWWVNQGASNRREKAEGLLRAGTVVGGGRRVAHHDNMTRLQLGDVVLHYWDGAIRSASHVTRQAIEEPTDGTQATEYVAQVDQHDLSEEIGMSEVPAEFRVPSLGPFNRKGVVKEGYLWEVASDLWLYLRDAFPERWPSEISWPNGGANSNSYLCSISEASLGNWEICKEHAMWGVGKENSAKAAAKRVKAGDVLNVWLGPSGYVAKATATGPARAVRSDDDAPWPGRSEKYSYVIPWELVEELETPFWYPFDGHHQEWTRLPKTAFRSGFWELDRESADQIVWIAGRHCRAG